MTELRLKMEKYINFEEALQAVDDLNLLNLGAVVKATKNKTPSSV